MTDRRDAGMAQGRHMLGARWDRVAARVEEISPLLADHVIGHAYGEVYPRPGLDLASRELMAITALTLQGLGPQLETHLIAALEAGLTPSQLEEAFLHLALYAGYPTALFGATHLRKVLDRRAESAARAPAEEGAGAGAPEAPEGRS